MTMRADQCKIGTEDRTETRRVMACHRKAAASLGSIQCKGSDNSYATGIESGVEAPRIGGLVLRRGQEMEGSPIMPDVVCTCRLPLGHVTNDPFDCVTGGV